MSQAATHIPMIGFTPNQFNLHNSAPERVTLRWGGVQFTLPAIDEVGAAPAKDLDGDPIPGSLVLRDGYTTDRDGMMPTPGSPPNWSAFEAIRNVLGVDPNTKTAIGVAAKGGISFLPNTPSKDLIRTIQEDGKRRYWESRVEWAQYTVAAYESRVAAARAVGMQAAPPDEDYSKAVQILKRRKDVLGVQEQIPPDEEDVEVLAMAKVLAMEMAQKVSVGKDIDRAALAEELLHDPKTRTYLIAKGYRIRKKGYLDVPEEPTEG